MSEDTQIHKVTRSPSELAEDISKSIPVTSRVDVREANKEEKEKLDKDQLQELRAKIIENDRLQANVDKIKDDNRNRRNLSRAILLTTILWMLLILFIVYRAGQGKLNLSDTVLVALITTTTVNVFGFLLVVVNYLFNKDKST